MEANVIARVLLICFYCEYHVNSKAIQNDILIDNICGPNINTNERVTCIYQRPGMYRTHLLLPTINRLTFERFDDSVLVVNRNIPNLKMLFISTTTPASHLNGCDFVHIETAATIKVIIDGQTFTCGVCFTILFTIKLYCVLQIYINTIPCVWYFPIESFYYIWSLTCELIWCTS